MFSAWIRECSSPRRSSLLTSGNGLLDHVLVDGNDAGAAHRRIELEIAYHPPDGLAQRTGAKALLASGVPGDGDECTARDLQVDPESLKVGTRGAEDRAVGLDEDSGQIRLGEVVEDDDRFESRDELRRYAVAEKVLVFEVVAKMKGQLFAHLARRGDDHDRFHRRDVLADRRAAQHVVVKLFECAAGDEEN